MFPAVQAVVFNLFKTVRILWMYSGFKVNAFYALLCHKGHYKKKRTIFSKCSLVYFKVYTGMLLYHYYF